VVTTVGNIRRVKGHDVFIRAAASIVQRFPEVPFSIGGDILEQTTSRVVVREKYSRKQLLHFTENLRVASH
jgi:glycosyltransferase involved in cell wall biosynthesis